MPKGRGFTPHFGKSTLIIPFCAHGFFFAYCIAKFDLVFEISRFFFFLTNPAGASPGGMVTDEVGVSGTGSKVPQPAKRLIAWGVWRIRMPPSI